MCVPDNLSEDELTALLGPAPNDAGAQEAPPEGPQDQTTTAQQQEGPTSEEEECIAAGGEWNVAEGECELPEQDTDTGGDAGAATATGDIDCDDQAFEDHPLCDDGSGDENTGSSSDTTLSTDELEAEFEAESAPSGGDDTSGQDPTNPSGNPDDDEGDDD